MAKGARRGPTTGLALDMAGNKIESLGRSTEPDGAARIDDLGKVKARNVDATSTGGLEEKTKAGRNVALSVISDGGREKLLIDANVETPAVAGSYLYTARIKDPLDYGQVVCVFMSYTVCDSSIFAGWTEVSPGVMQKDTEGPLSSALFDGVDIGVGTPGVESWLIQRVVFAFDYGLNDDDKELTGPWLVEDVGQHWEEVPGHPGSYNAVNTHARMRRAPGFTRTEDFVQGMTFQVQTGNTFGTDFITLATAIPVLGEPLTWSVSEGPTYNWNYTHRLLSSSQLVTEDVDTVSVDMSATMSGSSGSPGVAYFYHGFPTKPGTPGTTKLAAGPQEFHFERVSLATSDLTGETRLLARIIITDALGTTLITELDPIPGGLLTPNATVENLVIPYNLAADIDMTTVQRFEMNIGMSTTCSTPATLTVRVNSATHGTYWKGTFQVPSGGGTNYHPDLMGRNLPDQHRKPDVRDAIGTATVTGSGTTTRISIPAGHRSAALTIADNLVAYGIALADADVDDEVTLFVDGASPSAELTLVHLGLGDGTGIYAGVDVETGSGQNPCYRRPVALVLKHRDSAGHWRLLSAAM